MSKNLPTPPKGFRLLRPGEIIRATDMVWSFQFLSGTRSLGWQQLDMWDRGRVGAPAKTSDRSTPHPYVHCRRIARGRKPAERKPATEEIQLRVTPRRKAEWRKAASRSRPKKSLSRWVTVACDAAAGYDGERCP